MPKKKAAFDSLFVPEEEQPYPIPENWCWTYLSCVAQWGSGGTPSRKILAYYDGEISWIKTGELNDELIYESEEHISSEAIANSSAKLFPIHTVIIAMYGATIGKVGILEIEAATNQACACAVSSTAIDYKYLFYYAKSQKEAFIKKGKGGAQPNISQEIIKTHEIPLPPLPEQHRIVNCIESLFAKLDEAKEKAQAVVDGFELRKSAILHKAFTGELTERWRKEHPHEKIDDKYLLSPVMDSECPCKLPLTWKWVRMGSLGYTNIGLTYKPSDKSEEGTIVLRSSNIQNGQIDYQDIVRVSVDIPDNKMSQKGDILICARNGSKALVGKVAIIDKDGMSYGAFMAIFRSEFNSAIYYFLISPFFRNIIDNDVGTTTINQVTQAIIKNLPYPLAPEAEMEEIVRILDVLINKERQALAAAEAVLSQIDTMKKTILARAFRGELGTNDPKEEWAGELVKKAL